MFNVIRTNVAPASLTDKQSWTGEDVIKDLREIFHDKCYICETKEPLSLNVEHFDAHQNDPQKMFDWGNLFYACARCNNLKRHLFNNLLNCTNPAVDVLRLVRHSVPATPFSKNILVEPTSNDPKTIETANLIRKVFNEDNTGNKEVTSTYLRKRVYRRYAKLVEYINIYIEEDSLPEEKDDAIRRIANLMDKAQEYSAFLRWAVLESPDLLKVVHGSIN
jgi:hypothetical protein